MPLELRYHIIVLTATFRSLFIVYCKCIRSLIQYKLLTLLKTTCMIFPISSVHHFSRLLACRNIDKVTWSWRSIPVSVLLRLIRWLRFVLFGIIIDRSFFNLVVKFVLPLFEVSIESIFLVNLFIFECFRVKLVKRLPLYWVSDFTLFTFIIIYFYVLVTLLLIRIISL